MIRFHSSSSYSAVGAGFLGSIPASTGLVGSRLIPIVGQPPSLIRLPSGCAFHPRCPFAMEECIDDQPDLTEKFRVKSVPTLVLIKGKQVVDRLEGRASAPKIEAMLSRHLSAPAAAA